MSSSLLFKLPPELRDMVYEYTFSDTVVQVDSSGHEARNSGLVATCKTIRAEALPLYYENTAFYIPPSCGLSSVIQSFDKSQFQAMKELRFEVSEVQCNCGSRVLPPYYERRLMGCGLMKNVLRTPFITSDGEYIWCSKEEWVDKDKSCACELWW